MQKVAVRKEAHQAAAGARKKRTGKPVLWAHKAVGPTSTRTLFEGFDYEVDKLGSSYPANHDQGRRHGAWNGKNEKNRNVIKHTNTWAVLLIWDTPSLTVN